jgi:uncharacterized membrane protein
MVKKPTVSPRRLLISIGLLILLSLSFLVLRIIISDSMRYVFLAWNLILATLAPLLAWWLIDRVRQFGWWNWQQIVLAGLWLSFLPNSFYMITDLIHIRQTYEMPLIYDVIMLSGFLLSGLILGYTSLYLIHTKLLNRLQPRRAYLILAAVLLVCSFAIYLGRYVRWNSWDIILKPAGLLFDVSDRFVNPAAHQQTYWITLMLFALLFCVYAIVYEAARLIRHR